MPVRVLLVDDHDVVRLGLRALLAGRVDYEVCGEVADGANALAAVRQLAPDIVVLDLTLPGMSGFDTAVEIRRIAPQTKLILFSIHDVPTTARRCGADAFVSKAAGVRALLDTIDRVTQASVPTAPSAANPSAPRQDA